MSILGFVRRRPLVALGAVAGLWWLWPGASRAPAQAPARAQAAVLADGFAALDGRGRIVELDPDAGRRRQIAVTGAPAGGRVVGAASRIGLVWRDGKRVAVGLVDDDGGVEVGQRFGKRVTRLCEGTASNDHRFGVAWSEADGGVWVVTGPTARRGGAAAPRDAALEAQLVEPARADFCGVASADELVALLFTEGSRATLAMCGRYCDGRRVSLPRRSAVLGFGCNGDGCAIATRSAEGTAQVSWFTLAGKARWTKPLPHASPDTRVALAGTGARVAIAYATANEPVVVTASERGELATVWQGAGDSVPSLVYSAGKLLVARTVEGEVTASLVRAP